MPIIIPNEEAPQGSDKWLAIRRGIPTASEFKKIIKKNGERSDQRQKYMEDLAYERLTGLHANPFMSSAMKRGKLMEPESRETFEMSHDLEVVEVSFVYSDDRKRFGCSPDGLIEPNAGFETKDALPHIQLERLEKCVLPSEHYHQVQGCLYVCDREVWHFRSYCRGMRPLNIVVERDEPFLKALEIEIEVFCDELDTLVERYRSA
jgi:hypothetical protein